MPVLSNPRHERRRDDVLFYMPTSPRMYELLVRTGFYDPWRPLAYLDHVKRTSPKPRLRTR